MAEKKFSELTAKGAALAATDLVAISEDAGGGSYTSKSVTGANIKALVTDANLTTTDITTNDVSTSKHGFAPKAPNDTTKFLRGDGTWAVPAAGSSSGKFGIADSTGAYTYYTTLGAAITAASAGQTVEFFTDYTETGAAVITLKDGVNINGNGHTYTKSTNDSTHLMQVTGNTTCSVLNCNFVRSVGSGRVLNIGSTYTGTIDWSGTILNNTGTGKGAEINGIDTLNLTCISTNSAQAVTFIGCKATNCIGINTSSGRGIDTFGGNANLVNCYGESNSGLGIYNESIATNCTGVSSSSVGFQTDSRAYNCTGRSTSGVGFKATSSSIDVIGCIGVSSSGGGFANNDALTYQCSGISASNWGTEVTIGGKHYNFTSISTGSYAVNIWSPNSGNKLFNGNIISRYNNAAGYGIVGLPNTVANCVFQLSNSSAPYIYNSGTAGSLNLACNIYTGGTAPNVNITNSLSNTEDSQGNITI